MKSFFVVLLALFVGTTLGASPGGKKVRKKIEIRGGDHIMLGLVLENISQEKLKELKIKGGVKVRQVIPESPADEMGVEEDDIITAVDGKPVEDPEDVKDAIKDKEEGDSVKLTLLRDDKKLTKKGKLRRINEAFLTLSNNGFFGPGRHSFAFRFPNGKRWMEMFGEENAKGAFLGVDVQELTDQLRRYFGVDHGVLVTEVEKDSPAEKAGIKAGDIITNISGKDIEDYRDLVRTIRYYDPDDRVEIHISRKGARKTIKVKLGKRKFRRHFWRGKGAPAYFNFWKSDDDDDDGDGKSDDDDIEVIINKLDEAGEQNPAPDSEKKVILLQM